MIVQQLEEFCSKMLIEYENYYTFGGAGGNGGSGGTGAGLGGTGGCGTAPGRAPLVHVALLLFSTGR